MHSWFEPAMVPTMAKPFRDRLLAGEPLVGTVVTLTTSQAAEALAQAGYDWLWIDMEHGPLDLATVQMLIVAAGCDCAPIVRVPAKDRVWLARVLDLGPAGVIVPHVSSAADARAVVRACRYPPRGERSMGIARAQGYGPGLIDSLANAHERIVLMPQIEESSAVEEIEDILAVDGVDCVVVGPFDLSASLGHPGVLDHPEVVEAISRVAAACARAGKPAAIFAGSVDFARRWRGAGFQVLAVGADVALLARAAADQLNALR
ncbi:MAG: 2,4-dihydroxyhept-2-ene-1,7-dioic acid aldolase [Deltaproteobacteria bacterium]|nr:2,4-dihydroxyhept-2-ene-1,7-dioic acid aldolase [Deltaproteobacteria bacterium]